MRDSNVPAPTASGTAEPRGSAFAIGRHVVAGGGGASSGGAFAIQGTIGQPDADPLQPSTGGIYAISGGFVPGFAPSTPLADTMFANGFEQGPP